MYVCINAHTNLYVFLCLYARARKVHLDNVSIDLLALSFFVYLVTSVSEILVAGLSCFVVTLKPTNLLHLLLHSLCRVIINNIFMPFYYCKLTLLTR
jgi:hypothetical protein